MRLTMTPAQVATLLEASRPGATIYLVGAGGCGMSALGHLFLDLGYRVAGSDVEANEFTRGLLARGASIHRGHDASLVQAARPELVVYSSAVRLANPELQAAQQLQVPV